MSWKRPVGCDVGIKRVGARRETPIGGYPTWVSPLPQTLGSLQHPASAFIRCHVVPKANANYAVGSLVILSDDLTNDLPMTGMNFSNRSCQFGKGKSLKHTTSVNPIQTVDVGP